MSPLDAGATLCDGRYRLDEIVGRGGMAIVWRATDLQLERNVAIKVIADVLASDPTFVARFEREARIAASLNHPNLVKVFDFSAEGERPFLVMEFVAGGTLAEARGSLDPEALARGLLEAVAHIHAAGILHRDIKPANVLLGADGSPRLTDFGIARGDDTSALTQTGQVLGTVRYMAPEVAEGRPATPQSDLYSLGVLLRDLAGESASAPLRQLLTRMTATDPAARPASAADALAELDPTRLLPTRADAERADADTGRADADADPTRVLDADSPPIRNGDAPRARSAHPRRTRARRRPPTRGLHTPRIRASRIRASQAAGAAALLLAILVLVVVAASGGEDQQPRPGTTIRAPAAGAPIDEQIDQLVQIVRAQRKP